MMYEIDEVENEYSPLPDLLASDNMDLAQYFQRRRESS